jgi:hypothetical protein
LIGVLATRSPPRQLNAAPSADVREERCPISARDSRSNEPGCTNAPFVADAMTKCLPRHFVKTGRRDGPVGRRAHADAARVSAGDPQPRHRAGRRSATPRRARVQVRARAPYALGVAIVTFACGGLRSFWDWALAALTGRAPSARIAWSAKEGPMLRSTSAALDWLICSMASRQPCTGSGSLRPGSSEHQACRESSAMADVESWIRLESRAWDVSPTHSSADREADGPDIGGAAPGRLSVNGEEKSHVTSISAAPRNR